MIDDNEEKWRAKIKLTLLQYLSNIFFVQANSDFVWISLYFHMRKMYMQKNRYEFVW